MIDLPKLLYRGDSDKNNKRQLKTTLNNGFLLTGLSGGGNGREIFQSPLEKLVHKHVAIGWNETHFLSFTTNKEKAYYYGGGEKMGYCPTCSDDNWDFALLTLDTSKFLHNTQIETGVYKASYYPVCLEFLPSYTVILIDIATFLKKIQQTCNDNLSKSIYNAERDKEWLIYPATPMRDSDEFTSKFDMGCIVEKEYLKTNI